MAPIPEADHSSNEPYLVVGATGTVGRHVVSALLARRVRVRALVRNADRARALPDGADPFVADLRDAAAIECALDGARGAFYVSPHLVEEERCAETFVRLCRERAVRMVFVGSHIDGPNRFVRFVLRGLVGTLMTRYRPKFRLSERVRSEGGDTVVLVPSHFYQNDEYRVVREGLLRDHVYVHPFGAKGLNRVDVVDIAEAAARALTDRAIEPGAYPVVGPESLSGPDCAGAWGQALGAPVEYAEDDERFLRGIEGELEGFKLGDVAFTYRHLKKLAVPTQPRQLDATAKLLGRPSTPYSEYVKRTLSSWRA